MGLFFDDDKKSKKKITDENSIQLKKEELDISKHSDKIGDVELSKDIVTEHQVVDVPVTHEEVVIDRKAVDQKPSDEPIEHEEKIHIPVSEERVDVGKHTVVVGEVNARKQAVVENRHIDEPIRREEARVHTDGDSNIVRDELDSDKEKDKGFF
ncbi:MAG TPA: YsnF/AvaK domain-containing protein [Ruminiclostridium sp.]|nr:YsnF/AvaK domain-containing protein [Ruminiclostridium sp.]